MALPQRLSASDVKGWAKRKQKSAGKQAVKASKGKPPEDDEDDDEDPQELRKKGSKDDKAPGKAKAPADDLTKTAQPAPKTGHGDDQDDDEQDDGSKGSTPTVSVHVHTGKPNTEPEDPMNAGGPEVPEEFLDDMKGTEEDEDLEPGETTGNNPEIEEKLGEFAEVLEHRASEIEELAAEVEGNLLDEDMDVDTMRQAQALIPDDLRQDLVESMSTLSDEEIAEFCQHLAASGRIEDPELVAGFLRAAASDSTEDAEDEDDGIPGTDQEPGDEDDEDAGEGDEGDDDEDEENPKPSKKFLKKKAKGKTGDDDEEEDDEDEEDEDAPPKKKSKKPFPAKKKVPPS